MERVEINGKAKTYKKILRKNDRINRDEEENDEGWENGAKRTYKEIMEENRAKTECEVSTQ